MPRISTEGKLGLLLGLIGLGGGGAVAIIPELGWAMIVVAAVGAILLLVHHLRGKAWKLEPTSLIAIGLVGVVMCASVALGGIFWQRLRVSPPSEGDRQMQETPIHPAAPALQVAKSKFYSQRNKDDLANMLTDLTNILNNQGQDVEDNANKISNIWARKMQILTFPWPPNSTVANRLQIDELQTQLKLTSASIENMNKEIFDAGGLIQKYSGYKDEIMDIIKPVENTINDNARSILTKGITEFTYQISVIEESLKFNDRSFVTKLIYGINAAPLKDFQRSYSEFHRWITVIRERINAFRKAVLE